MSHSNTERAFGEQLEAVGLAYGSSNSVLQFVETEDGRQLCGVTLSEYRSPKELKEQFIGEDEHGRRICFDITYNEVGIEKVKILYGQSEDEFGIPSVVVLERGV